MKEISPGKIVNVSGGDGNSTSMRWQSHDLPLECITIMQES
jgi:hypothetical protein